MRWWREFKNPALKCERVGHSLGTEVRAGFVKPERADGYSYICMGVTQRRLACIRCRAPMGDWTDSGRRQGFTGFSWPSDQAATFDRDREYWRTQYFSPDPPPSKGEKP